MHAFSEVLSFSKKLICKEKFGTVKNKGHIQKEGPETRNFWWDSRRETRDHLVSVTRDLRPGTLKVGPETQDLTHR